jgi:RND family efflux transporter MFP subunit
MKSRHLKLVVSLLAIASLIYLNGCGSKGEAEQSHNSNTEADSVAQTDSSAVLDSNAVEDDTTEANLDLIPVEVADVYSGDISSYLLLSSTIETEKIVDVYPLVGGIIEEIFVEEGMYVKEGDALLQLVDDEIILNENQAEVDYQEAEAVYSRLEKMHNQQLVSDEEFETAKYALKQAEIIRDKARLTRERTTIRSPITGVVAERWVYEGNLVNTATKLFVITDPTEKICRVWVPERDMAPLKTGQKAFIASNIALSERFPGWIKRISPVVDPATGTCKVTIGIKDRQNRLRNGMFVRTEIVIDTHEDAVLAPKNALIYANDLEWV